MKIYTQMQIFREMSNRMDALHLHITLKWNRKIVKYYLKRLFIIDVSILLVLEQSDIYRIY